MLSQHVPRDPRLAGCYARLARWQGAVSSEAAIQRQAALLVTLYGRRQAHEEARSRASAALAYSNPLSADFWDRVAAAIRGKAG